MIQLMCMNVPEGYEGFLTKGKILNIKKTIKLY